MSENVENSPSIVSEATRATLDRESLEAKVNALLPPQYQSCFESVSPTSMGSAGLKYGSDSRIAWDQIWTHFCDLALAGGPPHRGSLLETPTVEEVDQEPAGYHLVCEETVRGIRMTSGLQAAPASESGWLSITCHSPEMAAWLKRAVMAENVFARSCEEGIQVPVGPTFRLTKEVKNVVVSLAKTCHYWQDHLSAEHHSRAKELFENPSVLPLLEPPTRPQVLENEADYGQLEAELGSALEREISLPVVESKCLGWMGVKCRDERMAAWMVRSSIAENILARREEQIVYLPLPNASSVSGDSFPVVNRFVQLYHLWTTEDAS